MVEPANRSRRVKVLIALEGVLGGTLRHLDYLLRFSDPEQFEIHLAVSARRGSHVRKDFRRWERCGWAVHEIPMQREISPGHDLRAFLAVLRLCRRERFDIVHTHCAKAGLLGRLAARLTGARSIHTPHLFPFSHSERGWRRWLYLALERLAARWTDRFVALSNYQLNVLLDAGLAGPERIVVIPNGIVPSEYQGPPKREARRTLGLSASAPVGLFAGRFRPQKGTDILLQAVRLMGQKPPGFRMLILGEGPLAGQIQREVSAAALDWRVRLCGRTQRMALYYAACDVVVVPSRAEGMPYVLLEAAAAARPVVASLVSGMEEFIQHAQTGFLVPPENPEALAATLGRLLSDRHELARVGRCARARFRDEWRAPETARRTCALYRQLALGSAQRRIQGGSRKEAR